MPLSSPPTTQPDPDLPAICLHDVSSYYGPHAILRHLNLTVQAGKTVLLWGDNGAGKTTFLNLLASRLRPTRGQVSIFGASTTKASRTVRELVSYMPVGGGLYGGLSGRENLQLAGVFYRHPSHTMARAITSALATVALESAQDAPVRTYSSGMKKRLSLAKLYLSGTPVWLLDEPYAALDGTGQLLVDAAIAQAKAAHRTVVVASHQTARVALLADAALCLQDATLTPRWPTIASVS